MQSGGTVFKSVPDVENGFLALFPHRFDYIWANYPNPGEPVEWRTESRHPLSDRLIQQSAYLYGVRFASQTQYCLLDIDVGSPYHPNQDPFAISRIVAALNPIGLVHYVACTSSYSGGIHLYFPFEQLQSSWKLAVVLSILLENAGFKVRPGQLEVFPDPKPYQVNGKLSLFNAHRLPLQVGSYLVDAEFQPIWSTHEIFVHQWYLARNRNDIDEKFLSKILRQIKRERYLVSTKAEKFINDLNADIEVGWTGYGQTNYLLGRIAMREYVFRHVLSGGKPLEGTALTEAIVNIAQALPGYTEWCRHRHEIYHRAEEWSRCIERSHYFHYGDAVGKFKAKLADTALVDSELELALEQTPSWNQHQSVSARERIRRAIATLLNQGALPVNTTARFHALVRCGIGGGTLYRHRDLWHPNYFGVEAAQSTTDKPSANNEFSNDEFPNLVQLHHNIPPDPPTSMMTGEWDRNAASHSPNLTSLFLEPGRNPLSDSGLSDSWTDLKLSGGNNAGYWDASLGMKHIIPHLETTEVLQQAPIRLTAQQQQQLKEQASRARQAARMQQFFDSGDPILMAEAIAWAKVNPGLLLSPSG